uniref:Uncharacterized protein n=1 Tax=Populus davidiana TaxID=266767 RepID=A0A6M2EYN7_9ROSI
MSALSTCLNTPAKTIRMKSSTFPKRKSNYHPPKFKASAFSNESTFIWSNLAFVSDDDNGKCSITGSNISSGCPTENRREYIFQHEEEMRIREKLAREIETELEREIMEGILLLVRRLSILRAKQINRALEDLNLDQYLSEICNSCNLCNAGVGDNVSRWHSRVQSPASEISRAADDFARERLYKKCLEMES